MAQSLGRPPGRDALPREDPETDRRSLRVRIAASLLRQLFADCARQRDPAPAALAEIDAAIFPRADDIDLHFPAPVLSDLERGADALLLVQERKGILDES